MASQSAWTITFVLGAPGAGKGTQCAKIVDRYGWKHLSTGDLLRAEVAAGTDLGMQAHEIMEQGGMVPTSLVLDLLANAMASSGQTRFLVDGFPRKLDQLQEFEEKIQPADFVLVFTLPEEAAVERLVKRGETSGRADDNEDTIRQRMRVFEEESQPVIDALKETGRVAEIDSSADVDDVFASLEPVMEHLQEKAAAKEAAAQDQLKDEQTNVAEEQSEAAEDEDAAEAEPEAEDVHMAEEEQEPEAEVGSEQEPEAEEAAEDEAEQEEASAVEAEQEPEAELLVEPEAEPEPEEEPEPEAEPEREAEAEPEPDMAEAEQEEAPTAEVEPEPEDEQNPMEEAEGAEDAGLEADVQEPSEAELQAEVEQEAEPETQAEEDDAPEMGESFVSAPAAPVQLPEDSKIVFVLGAPGAGKGTQCARIVQKYGWQHLSTGDLLRAEVAAGSELGQAAKGIMEAGEFVPTDMILDLLVNAMVASGATRFLVDGFPRKLDQLQEFEAKIRPADLVMVFTLPEEAAVERLVKRGETSGRADDNEDTIRQRMRVFEEESQPVIDALKETGRVAEIDSSADVDDVFAHVQQVVNKLEGIEGAEEEHIATEDALEASLEQTMVEEEPEQQQEAADAPDAAEAAAALAAQVTSVLVISGPSGVGKGTLIQRLMSQYGDKFGFSVSHTTRGPRPGEEDGVHYHFVGMEEMEAGVAAGAFLEHAGVHGNMYGTSLKAVVAVCAAGKIPVLDIDVQGAAKVRSSVVSDRVFSIFVAPPSHEELEARLRGRGTETEDRILARLANAARELEQQSEYDEVVVNGDLNTAYSDLLSAIERRIPGTFSPEELAAAQAEAMGRLSRPVSAEVRPPSKPSTAEGQRPSSKPATPQATSRPGTAEQPRVSSRPGTAEQPRVSSRPGTAEQPHVSSRPGTAEQPRVSSRPGTAEQPRAPSRPGTAEAQQIPKPTTPPAPPRTAEGKPATPLSAPKPASPPAAPPAAPPPPRSPLAAHRAAAAAAAQGAQAAAAGLANAGSPSIKSLPVRQYMDTTIVPILREALRALNDARPGDPLQFMADYLLAVRAKMANGK